MATTNQSIAQEQQQVACYGMTVEQVEANVEFNLKFNDAPMLVASMLSDAQEMIAMGASESARQLLNRAKYVIFHRITPQTRQEG